MKRSTIIHRVLILAGLAVSLGACDNPILALAQLVQATAASPVITVSLADGAALSAGGSCDLGTIPYGNTADLTIVIANAGKNDLDISTDGVTVSAYAGTEAGLFSITQQPSTTIAVGASSTLKLRFLATWPGSKSANISIASNDVSTATFAVRVTAQVNAPFSAIQGIARFLGDDHLFSGLAVTFTTVNGATGYELYRGTSTTDLASSLSVSSPLQTIAAPTDGSTTVTVTDATAGPYVTYYYAIRTKTATTHADGPAASGSITAPTLTGAMTTPIVDAALQNIKDTNGRLTGMATSADALYLGQYYYNGSTNTSRILKVTRGGATTTPLALSGDTISYEGTMIAVGSSLFVADSLSGETYAIRKVDTATGAVTTVVPDVALSLGVGDIIDLATDGTYVYALIWCDLSTIRFKVWRFALDGTGQKLVYSNSDWPITQNDGMTYVTESDGSKSLYFLTRGSSSSATTYGGRLYKLTITNIDSPVGPNPFGPAGVISDTVNANGLTTDGTYLYVADYGKVMKIPLAGGTFTDLCTFSQVHNIVALRHDGSELYVPQYYLETYWGYHGSLTRVK